MAPGLNTVPPSPRDTVQPSNIQTAPSASRRPSLPMGPPAAPISSTTGSIQLPPRDPPFSGDTATAADNSGVGVGPGKERTGFGADVVLTHPVRTASSSATTHCRRSAHAARERTGSRSTFRFLSRGERNNTKLASPLGQPSDTRAIYPSPAIRICYFDNILYINRASRSYRP